MTHSKYVWGVLVLALIFKAFFGVIEFVRTAQFSVASTILHFIGGVFLAFAVGFVSSRLPFEK